jgi:hypothetical protein
MLLIKVSAMTSRSVTHGRTIGATKRVTAQSSGHIPFMFQAAGREQGALSFSFVLGQVKV